MNNKNLILNNEFNENDVIKKNIEFQDLEIMAKDLINKNEEELNFLYLQFDSIFHSENKIKKIINNYKKLIMLLKKENKSKEDLINIVNIS